MKQYLEMNQDLHEYILSVSLREPKILKKQRDIVSKMPMSAMQSVPEETQFLIFLIKLINAKRIIEIGTFTGYSTLWMASVLPQDGKIITCDVDEHWTSIATEYWKEANVFDKIESRIAPAIETLDQLLDENYFNYFDLIYIDADKENYINYYNKSMQLIRPGGIIAIDNVLWGGSLINPENQSVEATILRQLNARLVNDNRITMSMLTIGDGLTLVIKNS